MNKGALLFLGLISACAGADKSATGPGTTTGNTDNTAAPMQATVSMVVQPGMDDGYGNQTPSSNRFSPANVTIAKGGTVTWTNGSGLQHNVTFSAAGGVPSNVPNHQSGTNARTFNTAGAFAYACTNHSNMVGTVNVK